MIHIAQFADIHFGTEDRDALARVETEIRRDPPDLIVVCGDLTQRGKRREFAAARSWLEAFSLPVLCVPGNHDTPLLNLQARLTGPFDRYERYFADWGGPSRMDDWTLAGLNTARGWQARRNWAEGVVNLDDLHAAAHAGGTGPTMVVCHHPFASLPGAPLRTDTFRGEAAETLLQESPASVLLTGHVHEPSASLRRSGAGTYLAIAAGTLSTRLRSHPPSFNRIHASATDVSVTSITVGTDQIQHYELTGPVHLKTL